MGKTIDEIGNRYSKLLVVSKVGIDRYGSICFECLCDCGEKKIVSGINLRQGKVKSCGCLHMRPKGESAFKHMFRTMKKSAEKRGYVWELTEAQVKGITAQNCTYCGGSPSNRISKKQSYNGGYTYNGIDRTNNKIGYISNNIVPCCRVCNRAKSTMTVVEFLKWIKRVAINQSKKEKDISKSEGVA